MPGFGGVLLGAIAARFSRHIDHELHADLIALTHEIEAGRRFAQPRLRHRFQNDRVGLTRSVHRLHRRDDGELVATFTTGKGSPLQHILAAVYAAGSIPPPTRDRFLTSVRRGLSWHGDVDAALFLYLSGRSSAGAITAGSIGDPVGWALEVLGMGMGPSGLTRELVQQGFREALRDAHPDHGGDHNDAAKRIAEISEARRILMTV